MFAPNEFSSRKSHRCRRRISSAPQVRTAPPSSGRISPPSRGTRSRFLCPGKAIRPQIRAHLRSAVAQVRRRPPATPALAGQLSSLSLVCPQSLLSNKNLPPVKSTQNRVVGQSEIGRDVLLRRFPISSFLLVSWTCTSICSRHDHLLTPILSSCTARASSAAQPARAQSILLRSKRDRSILLPSPG